MSAHTQTFIHTKQHMHSHERECIHVYIYHTGKCIHMPFTHTHTKTCMNPQDHVWKPNTHKRWAAHICHSSQGIGPAIMNLDLGEYSKVFNGWSVTKKKWQMPLLNTRKNITHHRGMISQSLSHTSWTSVLIPHLLLLSQLLWPWWNCNGKS